MERYVCAKRIYYIFQDTKNVVFKNALNNQECKLRYVIRDMKIVVSETVNLL